MIDLANWRSPLSASLTAPLLVFVGGRCLATYLSMTLGLVVVAYMLSEGRAVHGHTDALQDLDRLMPSVGLLYDILGASDFYCRTSRKSPTSATFWKTFKECKEWPKASLWPSRTRRSKQNANCNETSTVDCLSLPCRPDVKLNGIGISSHHQDPSLLRLLVSDTCTTTTSTSMMAMACSMETFSMFDVLTIVTLAALAAATLTMFCISSAAPDVDQRLVCAVRALQLPPCNVQPPLQPLPSCRRWVTAVDASEPVVHRRKNTVGRPRGADAVALACLVTFSLVGQARAAYSCSKKADCNYDGCANLTCSPGSYGCINGVWDYYCVSTLRYLLLSCVKAQACETR